MKFATVLLAGFAGMGLAIAQAACAGQAPRDDSGTLVTTLGSDTVVMENYARTTERLDGRMLVRVPGTVLVHYTVDLDGSGGARHSVVDITPFGTNKVTPRRVTIDFAHDSAFIDVDSAGHHTRSRVAVASPAMPQLMTGFGSSYGLYESPVFYTLYPKVENATLGDTVHVTTLDIASAQTGHREFLKRSPTMLEADYFDMVWNHVTLSPSGQVEGVDATGTTERTITTRAKTTDIDALAKAFAARDRDGHGLGVASPSAIEQGIVDGQKVVIGYSSPRRRGRTILGKVVPYGEVWRTGANEATTLFSDVPLDVGGARIPAGVFTLWTLPKSDGTVDLIINKQHGQWGTNYDPRQDLARVPMKVATVGSPADDFAIRLTGGKTGTLAISWDTFDWTVPISVVR